ncbi:hypothetical protein F5Y04DRAFT_248906 [Hypomontagnella monticulosa]|nr:hypothetical protein F5Y04DRAFT_248906 [Hypomontagnella monticulosa]
MSCFRIALRAIIQTCISQGAWIWVSAFRKGRAEARLQDFKMFDDASTGLWGSLVLIWRMRGKHLACAGAAIAILAQGFETFSSQMVYIDEKPTPLMDHDGVDAWPAPPPPRADTWHNVVQRGVGGGLSLGLSTKASIYDGIISETIPTVPVSCSTANCTWPPFPTLAVCGNCSEQLFRSSCGLQNGCTYTTASGTSITEPSGAAPSFQFTVVPSGNSMEAFNSNSQAYFSVFDIMSVSQMLSKTRVQAYECALWFCLKSFRVRVRGGIQNNVMLANWSKTEFSARRGSHYSEFVFVDIPPELYIQDQARYTVPTDSIKVLRSFMNSLMLGNASGIGGAVTYSSDWIEAMVDSTSDMEGWIARLSLSMTNDIRRSGSTNADVSKYTGTAYTMAPHVRVN